MATVQPGNQTDQQQGRSWSGLDWLLVVGSGILFAAGATLGGYWIVEPEARMKWATEYGNRTSVLGLLFGLSGFLITIWTVLGTRRIARDAQRQITAARAETREAISKIGLELAKSKCAEAHRRLTEALTAIRNQQWVLAAERCLEGRQACRQLAQHKDLEEQEKTILENESEKLTETLRYIEKAKIQLKKVPSPVFDQKRREPLDNLLNTVERLHSRLEKKMLEVPHANQ